MALPDLKKIGATVIKHGKTDLKKKIDYHDADSS